MLVTQEQAAALAELEAQHGVYDYACGGAPKAVFVDFNIMTDNFRSFRIAQDGTVEDVTDSLLEDPYDD